MDAEPHLLVYGDSQSGKSALLRGLIREIVRTRIAEAGPARRRRLPAVAARRGPGGVPAQLPHLGRPGDGPALRDLGDVPREPDPRARRHPRAAAQPVVVDRRGGVRARRRLRPGRHPAELAGRGAAAADGPGPRRRPARRGGPALRRCLAGDRTSR